MNIKSELREFFLRNVQVRDGSLRDKEVNYPITHFVNKYFIEDGVTTIRKIEVNNRFTKGSVPSDEIYEKLFNSIIFKENVDDSATTTKAGLVKIANDSQLQQGLEKDEKGITLVPTVKQLANKANTIATAPTISGTFPTNSDIFYSISVKVINKLLYVKFGITTPVNAIAGHSVIIDLASYNTVFNSSCDLIRNECIDVYVAALQDNKTVTIQMNTINILNNVSTTKVYYSTGWKLVL